MMLANRISRRGMTLLEVVIASAVLMMITLVVLSASFTVSDASATQGTALDMDRDAMRFLSTLRHELRQSGYEVSTANIARVRVTTGTTATAATTGDAIQFYMRVRPDVVPFVDAWTPTLGYLPTMATGAAPPAVRFATPNATSFPSPAIRYRTVAATNGRLEVRREQGNDSIPVLGNVQALTFTFPTDSTSVTVQLQLVRRGHKAVNGLAPPDVVKTYTDTVEMLNSPGY